MSSSQEPSQEPVQRPDALGDEHGNAYCLDSSKISDCAYLVNCIDCAWSRYCKNAFNLQYCSFVTNSSNMSFCVLCDDCKNCENSVNLTSCEGCKNCSGCVGCRPSSNCGCQDYFLSQDTGPTPAPAPQEQDTEAPHDDEAPFHRRKVFKAVHASQGQLPTVSDDVTLKSPLFMKKDGHHASHELLHQDHPVDEERSATSYSMETSERHQEDHKDRK